MWYDVEEKTMTMIVRITGDLIFTTKRCAYPIRGEEDDVPGVCYRSRPREWIASQLLPEWFSEPRVHGRSLSGIWTIARPITYLNYQELSISSGRRSHISLRTQLI